MKVVAFVHEGLGNSSYLIELGEGRAVLVDPDRSVGRYLARARAGNLKIEAVLETHLHADFVSGAREVASATGARILLPAAAQSRLQHEPLSGGARVDMDGVRFSVIASPGHTPEHVAYLVQHAAAPFHLFSGGSLIVGGAARTDLIAPDMTEKLTRDQFRTLHGAFDHLPDETLLLPTHGGGSFCSTGAGIDRTSTLGQERLMNPAMLEEDEEEFVRWFPRTFPGTPSYYFRMRAINQAGPRLVREIQAAEALSPREFDARRASALVVDARPKEEYARGHVPGALSIPFRDAFTVWLGWLAPEDTPLLFVTQPGQLEAVVDQALLVGYERFAGWLEGGMHAWKRAGLEVRRTDLETPDEARMAIAEGAIAVDVREPDEFSAGHVEGALNIPLGMLPERAAALPADRPLLVYCAAGDRASSAASILERAGLSRVINLAGGTDSWRSTGLPLVT